MRGTGKKELRRDASDNLDSNYIGIDVDASKARNSALLKLQNYSNCTNLIDDTSNLYCPFHISANLNSHKVYIDVDALPERISF